MFRNRWVTAVFGVGCLLLASSVARAGIECPIDCPVTDLGGDNDAGECGAVFNFTIPADDCDVTCDPPSGSFFPVGTTFVTCTTEDDECGFNVVITDAEPPTVGDIGPLDPCYPNTTAGIQDASSAILAVATDNCAVDGVTVKTSAIQGSPCSNWAAQLVAVDEAGNESDVVHVGARIDGEDPETGPFTIEDCYTSVDAAEEDIEARIREATTDNCPGELDVHLDCSQVDCTLTCYWGVSDACGNGFVMLDPLTTILDDVPPKITCPPDITVDRGEHICNPDIEEWLNDVEATDNCPGQVVIGSTVPACGFPAGETSEVTFTATDACGLSSSCTAKITVAPHQRANTSTKGSLLAFSKVDIRWDASGNLIQDTFLDFANDADAGGVDVQAYFINGDISLEEITADDGSVIQEGEPGWNSIDCRFHLTKNQPHYWSAAHGSDKCQPFTLLDDNGRPDSSGGRMLRGFVVMWAVKFHDPQFNENPNGLGYYEEIRWNHLKGDALIVNYAEGSAWEYNAWALQSTCGAEGEGIPDCINFNKLNGVCCTAEAVPGYVPMDGFSYSSLFDKLLLDFYGTGTAALSSGGVGGVDVSLDTDLTLHSMDVDLRQDGFGPVLTKAEFEVFNQNETKLSGLRRCICCWDQTMVSEYVRVVGIPNYFLRRLLGTDKGQARIDGVASDECDYLEICGREPVRGSGMAGVNEVPVLQDFSENTPLLGLAMKLLGFKGGAIDKFERAGMNLVGVGEQWGFIQYDVPPGNGEARAPEIQTVPTRTDVGPHIDKAGAERKGSGR